MEPIEEISEDKKDALRQAMTNAWAHFDKKEYDEAKSIADKLLKEMPGNPACHYLMGHIYWMQGNRLKASAKFLEAIEIDEDDNLAGHCYYWLGELYKERDWMDDHNPEYIFDKEKSEEYYRSARAAKNYPPNALFHFQYDLKGQDKIDLFEQGIAQFPDMPEFYILLAHHYEQQGMFVMHFDSLKRALEKDLVSASLHYNLGQYYVSRKDYDNAVIALKKAAVQDNYSGYDFAINYQLGRIAEIAGDFATAEEYYASICQQEKDTPDSLFGILGLISIYIDSDEWEKLDELVLNLNITKDLLIQDSPIGGRPIRLCDQVMDHIEIENLPEIYKKFKALKLTNSNSLLNGKKWLLRGVLAQQTVNHYEQYKAAKNALKSLNTYHYDFLYEIYTDSVSNLLYYKTEKFADKVRLYNDLLADLKTIPAVIDYLAKYIDDLFKLFFEEKDYTKVVALSEQFTMEQLAGNDGLFMAAYANNELNKKAKAEQLYQYYLTKVGENSAVLNNLGNLVGDKGDYAGAVVFYKRGLAIDPEDDHINKNLARTSKQLALAEEKAARVKSQQQEYAAAIHSLKSENDFVLDKLAQFIERAQKESTFNDWKLPVPKHNFSKFLSVNKQTAESLLGQWLKKQYLVDTKKRDDYNVVIYAINPLLETEINRLQKFKIPKNWIDGFMGISAEGLEEKGYFALIARVEKINKKFRVVFERDIAELFFNYFMSHTKSTIVLSGSLVELALIYHCEKKKLKTIPVQEGGKTKNKALYSCVLNDLITYVEQTKAFGQDFTHLGNLSRVYRNFVHPGKELKDGIDSSKADICFISTISILKKIL